MKQNWIKLLIVGAVTLLALSTASGISCTRGFLTPIDEEDIAGSLLVPLLSRTEIGSPQQWIFPSMQFTCEGQLNTWIFRGIRGVNVVEACQVHLTTWRLDTRNPFVTQYKKISTTERNKASVTEDESYFTYQLSTPVKVEPGDIIGVEMGTHCGTRPFDSLLSLNISRSGDTFYGYRRFTNPASFYLDSSVAVMEENLIPLVQVFIGSPTATEPQRPPDFENVPIRTGDANSDPEVTNNELGDVPPTVAIAAGVIGGFVGLIVLVSICVCVGCLSRHIQVHVHYTGKRDNNTDQAERTRSNTANSSEMVLQANSAYRQMPQDRQLVQMTNGLIFAEQGTWLNQSHHGTHSRGEQFEHQREARAMTSSSNRAYHHRNQTQTNINSLMRQQAHFIVPQPYESPTTLQQSAPLDDDYGYEYIL